MSVIGENGSEKKVENITEKIGTRSKSINKSNESKIKFLTIALFFIATLGIGFFGGRLGANSKLNNLSIPVQKQVINKQGDVIRQVASSVGQSVVSINDTQQSSAGFSSPISIFGGGEAPSSQQAAGTGIILTNSGYVLTNRHVVPIGTTNISITLDDGTVFDNVSVIGATNDRDTLDVAILKINDLKGKTLIPAKLGDSSKAQVGDSVVAIGNALGQFQNTVTSGIISGFGRKITASDSNGSSSENLDGLIQTDAAINEGNSGGPLSNLDGQVVGLNVATAGGAQNIGFSIPINNIKGIIKYAESTGKFARPYIGVLYAPIDPKTKSNYNLTVDQGAYIIPSSVSGTPGVIPDSPADKAGLKEGDVITAVNNVKMSQAVTLSSLLDINTVGASVNLQVLRDGKTLNITATIGSEPSN